MDFLAELRFSDCAPTPAQRGRSDRRSALGSSESDEASQSAHCPAEGEPAENGLPRGRNNAGSAEEFRLEMPAETEAYGTGLPAAARNGLHGRRLLPCELSACNGFVRSKRLGQSHSEEPSMQREPQRDAEPA